MTAEKTWTVNAIKDAMRAAGSHWFDPDTMRTFGTKVLPEVYQGPGGVFFVTQDDQYRRELPKMFTVRQYKPDSNDIGTVGDLCQYKTAAPAKKAAQRAAAGRGWPVPLVPEEEGGIPYKYRTKTTSEEFKPVSDLDQFAHDLQKHTNPSRGTETATVAAASALMLHARSHHRLMEKLCSDEAFCRQVNEEGEHPAVIRCREEIRRHAREVGATGVVFSGDPRGCTVKLTFADGFTNDWAKEGYCVPTGKGD